MKDSKGYYSGRCNCGSVNFVVKGKPVGSNYCHCNTCKRQTGAPVFLGVRFAASDVSINGVTKRYKSSSTGNRHFCPECGSNIFMTFQNNEKEIEILIGCLDKADGIEPTCHIWVDKRIPWFDVNDALPRHRFFSDG